MDYLKVESYKRGIAISTVFNLIAKIAGIINSIIIAYYFGTQGTTDVYFYVYATLTLMAAFMSNLNGLVLIPESMRIREQDGPKDSMYFINFFIYLFLAFAILISLILLVKPVETFTIFSKFDHNLLNENIRLMQLMIPYLVQVVIISLLTEVLISYKYFTLPMIAGMLNSTFSIIFVLLFHSSLQVSSIALGIIISSTINIVLLIVMLKNQLQWDFSFKMIKINGKTLKNLIFAEIGNISSVAGTYVPIYIISGFNQGIITALNYGRNLANVPDQFFTTQFSSIFGIRLNEAFAKKQYDLIDQIFYKSINALLFILLPLSFLMFICSYEIIAIIYKRGQFDINSVQMTSEFFKYFALTLPLLAINTFLSKLFSAGQKIDVAFYSGLGINIFFLILLYLCIKFIGPIGYPLAILAYLPISLFIVNFYLCRRYFPQLKYFNIIKLFFNAVFINILVGIPCFLLLKFGLNGFNPISVIFIICLVYLTTLILLINFLKSNEQYLELQHKICMKIKLLQ